MLEDEFNIEITKVAESELEKKIVDSAEEKEIKPENFYLRLYVAGAGPGGINHGMALTTEIRKDDEVINKYNFKVLIDPMSKQYLNGAEVDYVTHKLGGNFKIVNPNQIALNGCSSCGGDAGCC